MIVVPGLAWMEGGSSPATRFIRIAEGKYKTAIFRNEKYNKEAGLDKKKILIEMNPQLTPTMLFSFIVIKQIWKLTLATKGE